MNSSKTHSHLILASSSPRRQKLLQQMGLHFITIPVHVEEALNGINPELEVAELAERKVHSLLSQNPRYKKYWIVGADTVIVCRDRVIGKPRFKDEAREYITSISGNTHQVITGVALFSPKQGTIKKKAEITEVDFASLTEEEIEWYLDTGEWQGAAGGYRIQEKGSYFIKKIHGSFSNVMGLPIHTFYGMLKDYNYPVM